MLLNSCRTTLKIQPFPYRGPKGLQRLEKLLAASPTHLGKGEAPFASSRLTPHDLIQNPDSDKTPLEIDGGLYRLIKNFWPGTKHLVGSLIRDDYKLIVYS